MALKRTGQRYMLPYRLCTFAYFREVLSGAKSLLRTSEAINPNLPRLRGLSLTRILDKVRQSDDLMKFFPGTRETLTKEQVTHDYAVTIVNSAD